MRTILFASDFGPASEWVGICHAVIAGIAPAARIIDLTHSLTPFDVQGAGITLQAALPFAPPSIAVLVVDPGVGTARRGLAARTERGDILVGPDNGLLPAAALRLGGILEARALTERRFHLPASSATFHARDVFSPVAAHLAAGAPLEKVGSEVDVSSLAPAWQPRLLVERGRIECEVIDVDHFGNVRLAATPQALDGAGLAGRDRLRVSSKTASTTSAASPHSGASSHAAVPHSARRTETYGDLAEGELGLVVDSFGWLALCLNRANAAVLLAAHRGSVIVLD